jgi:hypothetical protein
LHGFGDLLEHHDQKVLDDARLSIARIAPDRDAAIVSKP